MAETNNESGRDRPRGRGRIYDSITDTIGDTPLVRIDRIAREKGVRASSFSSSPDPCRIPDRTNSPDSHHFSTS